jgi:hypothetical protein
MNTLTDSERLALLLSTPDTIRSGVLCRVIGYLESARDDDSGVTPAELLKYIDANLQEA